MNPGYNRNHVFYGLLFCFFMQGISCINTTEELTEREKLQIKSELTGLLHNNFRRIEKEGYMADLETLDNTSCFFWIPPGHTLPISYDSVAAIIKKFIPGNRSVVSRWDTLVVQPVSKIIATYAGKYHSVYTDTAGRVMEFNMEETGTFIKRKEGWKIISGKTSVVQ